MATVYLSHCRTTDFDVTLGKCVVPVRNLVRAICVRHKTLYDCDVKVSLPPWQRFVLSHCRTADFDVTLGQCIVPVRSLACAVFIPGNGLFCPTVV